MTDPYYAIEMQYIGALCNGQPAPGAEYLADFEYKAGHGGCSEIDRRWNCIDYESADRFDKLEEAQLVCALVNYLSPNHSCSIVKIQMKVERIKVGT